jgi:ubiquinone/menaquinone biosynthesis C-methylase UbiE
MNTSQYAFADRAHERRRLASQAELFDPLTERVFRAAGLGIGMRVLDLGSGAGDVSILAARLVGREGEVVGVERDPQAVASATARVAQAGISNVRFIQGDAQTLDNVPDGFDAAVGRLFLMYLPDPIAALRRTARLVRPGGLICFHEGDMAYDWASNSASVSSRRSLMTHSSVWQSALPDLRKPLCGQLHARAVS